MSQSKLVSVEFRDIVYGMSPPKYGIDPARILHGVSGYVAQGGSLAILGPSGSGKTTLLNLLAGRSMYEPESGTVLSGGVERNARTKRSIRYVMQDDLFFSALTVRETLQFRADVQLPRTVRKIEKEQRIDDILASLRLTRCQDTLIIGISGGERKRLSIATELIPDPTVLHGPRPYLGREHKLNDDIDTHKSCSSETPSDGVIVREDETWL